MALQTMLAEMGLAPHVLSKGYGGSTKSATRVDESKHRASETGDEPLLLSNFGPVWVGASRTELARKAVEHGADVILLDDGFQDPSLAKHLSIMVVDAGAGFGNGRVIPAGPLREPLEAGLARADLVLLIGPETQRLHCLANWPELTSLPVLQGELEPLQTGQEWKGLRVLAFAGIGRPEKFFQTLKAMGADIVAAHALADHAPLPLPLLKRMQDEAWKLGAELVTTEKDAVRLPASYRSQVITLPVRLRIHNPEALKQSLDQSISLASSRSKSSKVR
jgi:tetraacyldisaccharide 4'-kinase